MNVWGAYHELEGLDNRTAGLRPAWCDSAGRLCEAPDSRIPLADGLR
jgi:hypothetical protein